jgi:tRNA uridine 5-carboxymethylaminomethyl modification enzyme
MDLFNAASLSATLEDLCWAEMEIKYKGYLARERCSIEKLGKMNSFELPADLPYRSFQSISYEAREKLDNQKPGTLGSASRIPGVSPSDLQGLVLEVLRWRQESTEPHVQS